MPPKSSSSEESSPTFEQAMERLESIVEEMESDQLPLEKLISRFEEGVKLVSHCGKTLDAAEKRIQIISQNAEGKLKLEPFAEKGDEDEG